MGAVSGVFSTLSYESVKSNLYALGVQAVNNPVGVIRGVALNVLKTLAIYNLYEAALSDILCLKTFRHGTSPSGWLKIHFTGPDLERGGTGGEATFYAERGLQSPYAARDKGRFYAVQDRLESHREKEQSKLGSAISYLENIGTTKYYALRSSIAYWSSWVPLPTSIKKPIIEGVVELLESPDPRVKIFGLFSPTIKIHLDPDRVSYPRQINTPKMDVKHSFEADEHSEFGQPFSGACYTKDPISVTDMGICGVLKNGLNTRVFERILENKGQFLWGVVQLVAAVALTAFVFPGIISGGDALLSIVAKPIEVLFTLPGVGET
ncbi:MAG: hypothetical protein ACXU9U_00610, partial [Parachlamydiaceae bacterium]